MRIQRFRHFELEFNTGSPQHGIIGEKTAQAVFIGLGFNPESRSAHQDLPGYCGTEKQKYQKCKDCFPDIFHDP